MTEKCVRFYNRPRCGRSGGRCVLLIASITLTLAGSARAQLPAARLNTLFPPGGKIGTTVDITVSGLDLDGATELRFSNPSITAKPKDESESGTDRKFTVTI